MITKKHSIIRRSPYVAGDEAKLNVRRDGVATLTGTVDFW
jgi:hypothetical protein